MPREQIVMGHTYKEGEDFYRILCVNYYGKKPKRVLALSSFVPGRLGIWDSYGENGEELLTGKPLANLEVAPESKRLHGWVNIYPQSALSLGHIYIGESREVLERHQSETIVARLEIDMPYFDGEGVQKVSFVEE